MKKDQIIILEKKGVILISGADANHFLQNIITNDIKSNKEKFYFFSPFKSPRKIFKRIFIIQSEKGYLLDCSEDSINDLLDTLNKYKLGSNVQFRDLSSEFVVGIIIYTRNLKNYK